jgi:hypothetical protein
MRRKCPKANFTACDDEALADLVISDPEPQWVLVAQQMPHPFTPRQCRERWKNYLNPQLTHSGWSEEEDRTILSEYNRVGNRWIAIADLLKGRSAPAVRNRVFLLQRQEARNAARALAATTQSRDSSVKDERTRDGGAPGRSLGPPTTAARIDADDFLSLFFVGL